MLAAIRRYIEETFLLGATTIEVGRAGTRPLAAAAASLNSRTLAPRL